MDALRCHACVPLCDQILYKFCALDRPCTKVTFVPTQDEPRDYLDELVELRQKEKSGVMLIIGDNMEVR